LQRQRVFFVMGLGMKDRTDEVDSAIAAFRCPKDLVGAIEQQAAVDCAVLRDLRRAKAPDINGPTLANAARAHGSHARKGKDERLK
jgi:hypothetical protein